MRVINKIPLFPNSKFKIWNLVILVSVPTVLLLLASGYQVLNYQQKITEHKKTEADISANVITADGYLEPKGEVILISPTFGMERARIEELRVKRGELVKAGDIIAVLDSNSSMVAALENAHSQEQIASAQLELIKAGAKKGEIAAQKAKVLENRAELNGQIATQNAEIGTLEAQLAGEKRTQNESIERIKTELKKAQKDCDRYQSLYLNGAVSISQMESFCLLKDTNQKSLQEAEANLKRIIDSRKEEIKKAQENLNRTRTTVARQLEQSQATLYATAEVRPVNVAIAAAQLKAAKALVKQSRVNLGLTFVRSPIDGQILEIHAKPGELATSGIVEVGDTKNMVALAEVYETDIEKVRLKQKVEIKSSALSESLHGTVNEIGFKVAKKENFNDDPVIAADARVVKVRVLLDEKSSKKSFNLTNLKVDVLIKY